jgi:pimeloyl-ACP methyl ester carboxylesterase
MSRVRLSDGRNLAYVAVGPADGELVLYLHGAIGSPQAATPELAGLAGELGLRYVMVSRPGFGGSDALRGRTLTGFAADLGELADGLGHRRFAVVGVSAGGPYALACAHELPERVPVTAVVSCMTQGGCATGELPVAARLGLRALRARPGACIRTGDVALALARRHPRLVTRVIRASAPAADRDAVDAAGASERAAARFLAAAAGGVGAMVDDYLVCHGPWGFAPQDVRGLVQLWHGMQDPLVPVDEALGLAAALPHVQAALDPDEGHFFYRRRLREILGRVAAACRCAHAPAVRSAGRGL